MSMWSRHSELKRKKFKILYVQYTIPSALPPLERSAGLFHERGWSVNFLGSQPEGQTLEFSSELESLYRLELLTHYSGLVRGLWSYFYFWWRAWRRVRREKPDVVYVSDLMAYPVGLLVAITCKVITVQHEHDTPFQLSLKKSPLLWFREAFIRRADICINPQSDRAAHLRAQTGREDIDVVFNVPLLSELRKPKPQQERNTDLTLWHHGSLGPGRLPLSIIDALQYLPEDVVLGFAGYETSSTKGFVATLMAHAEALGVAHRVTYHGAMRSRTDLYAEASRAHIGMAIFIVDFIEPMAGASNKPFDFLGCGLALIVNDTDEWKSFFGDKSVAKFCNPERATDIAEAVYELHSDREKLNEMASRGRSLIESELNYATQFQPVLDRIDSLILQRGF